MRWVSEDLRPFKIVNDRGFKVLMISGRPGYKLPSPMTVSRDVRVVFVRTRARLARMLQVCISVYILMVVSVTHNVNVMQRNPATPSYGTDAWTSPNHKAFVAFSVHFELDGNKVACMLDIVEVAKVRTECILDAELL